MSGFNSWFQKFAIAAAFFVVICLPAVYWACERFFDLNLSKSAQATWSRIFSRFDDSSSGGGGDEGD